MHSCNSTILPPSKKNCGLQHVKVNKCFQVVVRSHHYLEECHFKYHVHVAIMNNLDKIKSKIILHSYSFI